MEQEYLDILKHLLIALAMGGLIGFERSYHGRPAGFRNHSLVCVAIWPRRSASPQRSWNSA